MTRSLPSWILRTMNKHTLLTITIVILLILTLSACSNNGNIDSSSSVVATLVAEAPANESGIIIEHDLIEIPLPGELASASMEYSGLAWYKDDLILLPQYPNGIWGNQDGLLYAINQDNLDKFLKDPTTELAVKSVLFDDGGLSKRLKGFEGFEAIVFIEDSVYMAIETRGGDPMKSFIVKGSIESVEGELKAILLDGSSQVELRVQNNNSNASYEALSSDGEFIYAFFEQNGKDQNANPFVLRLDADLENQQEIPLDAISYRVTDATLIDGYGTFWMINYFFPGDTHLAVDEDPISTRYGLGESHQQNEPVERLIKLISTNEGFQLADEPPLYLQLLENDEARNWEGLVRFGEQGFLVITDKFPDSILGYIAIQ